MSRQSLRVVPDGRDGFPTIGEALAQARTGAVVRVAPGRYRENLTVRTRLTIVADGDRGSVEICPPRGTAVVLVADAVMLTDLTLRGGSEDLPVVDAPRGQVAMDGCTVVGARLDRRTGQGGRLAGDARLPRLQPGGCGRGGHRGHRERGPRHRPGTPGHLRRRSRRAGPHRRTRLPDAGRARGNGVLANGEAQGRIEDCDISTTEKPGIALEGRCGTRVLRTTVHDTSVGVFVTSASPGRRWRRSG